MPSPSAALSTLRPDLAASLEEFNLAADRNGFIGLRVLPVLEVAKATGLFGKIPIESLLQNRVTNRAAGGGYSRGSWKFTTDTFACEEHGAEEPVDDREAALYSDFFNAEVVSAQRCLDVVLRNMERRIADAVFNAVTWTPTSITNEWDDYANATPIDDVEAAVRRVWTASGLWPDALVINRKVFRNLRQCEQVIERIQASGAGFPVRAADITAAQLAAVFDLSEIIVGGSPRNTAIEGQDVTIGSIWSDEYAMVAKICRSNDMREPGLGRCFHWAEDGSQIGGTIETYRDESVRSEIVRVRHDVDEKILYVEAADLMDNITT